MPLLAHEIISSSTSQTPSSTTILFLHGILGSKNNWKSFARRFVDETGARAVIADLRNHGESHGFARPHSVDACADDVASLLEALSVERAIVVGHSYGGKVALDLARVRSELVEERVAEIWSLDAPPGLRAWSGHGDVERVVSTVQSLPLPIRSRKALVDDLTARGLSLPLAQWMTTNLKPLDSDADAGFVWKFDLSAIPEMLQSFGALDLWPFLEQYTGKARVVLVRAGRGARYTDDDVANAARVEERGVVRFRTMENVGHWLHTEDPDALLRLMLSEMRP